MLSFKLNQMKSNLILGFAKYRENSRFFHYWVDFCSNDRFFEKGNVEGPSNVLHWSESVLGMWEMLCKFTHNQKYGFKITLSYFLLYNYAISDCLDVYFCLRIAEMTMVTFKHS